MFQEELRLRANNTNQKEQDNTENSTLLLSEEEERIYLTQELDQARRELTKFRKEMDGLSAQLNDMASEMVCIWFSPFFLDSILRIFHRLILVLK